MELEQILRAPVYDVAKYTPLDPAPMLSKRLGVEVWLKREDLQPIFSFKIRGAYAKLASLTPEERKRGVIAASAGNHAQGVAYGARHLGIKSLIVMPSTTPAIKVEAVEALGAKVVLKGDTYDEAQIYATDLAKKKNCVYIHPFDDPHVIAGQGTVGMEILRQQQNIDTIFVPVGGGGLIAGIVAYVSRVAPHIKIIGVEPEDAATLHDSLKAARRVVLDWVGIFADGVAVKQIGKHPFDVVRNHVHEVILVKTDEICAAIKDVFGDTRVVAEPSGAIAIAGLKKYIAAGGAGTRHVAIVSGANTNFDRLRHVAERAELGENREALLAVTIPERPGSFRRFCRELGKSAMITEFNYRYADATKARVFCGVKTASTADRTGVAARLIRAGYEVTDLSDNEMAKLHIRYMVGGRGVGIGKEVLVRVQFPERPGALIAFLETVGKRWNISMFHYRNHGAAYGRVLAGFQIGDGERKELFKALDSIGYRYWDETDNTAYDLFLSDPTER